MIAELADVVFSPFTTVLAITAVVSTIAIRTHVVKRVLAFIGV